MVARFEDSWEAEQFRSYLVYVSNFDLFSSAYKLD
jgi:hypothetical protein